MKSFSTSTLIHFAPQAIWDILTDATRWTAWNTTVERVVGKIALDEKITVYAKVNPGRAFPLRVSEYAPPHRMVWSGGMPCGLLKGQRTYTLTEQPGGEVVFAMHEAFTGLLAPLLTRSIPNLQLAFDEFAAALKQRAAGAT